DACLHDWYEYAGKLLERRAADKERKRDVRKTSQSVHGMSGGHPADGVRTVPYPTVPNPTKPNLTKIINHLNRVGPEHLMPLKVPQNIPQTLATAQKAKEFAFLENGTYPFLLAPEFSTDWAAWLDMRRRMKWDNGPRAMVLALNKLHSWPIEKAVLSLQLSVERCYRGVFEPNEEKNGKRPGSHSGKPAKDSREFAENLSL
nr:hypothetical protein [Fibrobacterota bacterium]